MENIVRIRSISHVTHNVLQIVTERPENFTFNPGQAADVTLNKQGWENNLHPFTFTSLPWDDFLEFTIKTYPERKGITAELLNFHPGDELVLHDVFGAIQYKGEGVFIAGGAGVTPFISIFRFLNAGNEIGNNMLIFSNKTKADIIREDEFRQMLGDRFINILTHEPAEGYPFGHITEDFLRSHISDFRQQFYVCGPDPMIADVKQMLSHLGVTENAVVVEL